MTNPYDPITGKWLTPFSWVMPTPTTQGQTAAPADTSTPAPSGYGGQDFGGSSIGYNGQSKSLGDWLTNTGAGVLGVLGAPGAGMLALAPNLAVSAKYGTPPSLYNTVKALFGKLDHAAPLSQALPAFDPSIAEMMNADHLSAGGVNASQMGSFGAGDLTGMAQNGLNGIGSILGGAPNSTHSQTAPALIGLFDAGGTMGFDPGGDRGGEINAGGNFDSSMEGKNSEGKFEHGGLVTPERLLTTLWDDLDSIDQTNSSAPPTKESEARFTAAMDAIASGRFNEAPEDVRRQFIEKYTSQLGSGRDLEYARASYPGFAEGGPVISATTEGAPHAGLVLGPPKGDKVPLTAAAGSFVLSRDMVKNLGGPMEVARMFPGKAPAPNQASAMVPIRASGGEFVVSPADVKRAGGAAAIRAMAHAPFGWSTQR